MIKIDIRTLPPKNPKITLRRIFGEEGSAGTVASSKVVTSETFCHFNDFLSSVLMSIFIIAVEILDDRVKKPEDIEEVMGLTLLGVIPDMNRM